MDRRPCYGEQFTLRSTTASGAKRLLQTCSPTVPGGDPVFGDECALDVLGIEDAGNWTGGEINAGDGDACYDVFGNGVELDNFRFQKNLHIPCGKQFQPCIVSC